MTGLLALLLLTDARREARVGPDGDAGPAGRARTGPVGPGPDPRGRGADRGGTRRRPGPYQLHAAIAACHSGAATPDATDWREIAALYGELVRYEPTPVVEANRAVAVAMAEGPAGRLASWTGWLPIRRLARWPQLHIARAELLGRLHRRSDAIAAYRAALELEPQAPERAFIGRRCGSYERGWARSHPSTSWAWWSGGKTG